MSGSILGFEGISQSVQKLSRVRLCDTMDCSMPGFPVHCQFPELAQTHVHQVTDAIQPSHTLSSASPPVFSLSQHQVFSNESVLHIRWPKYWSFSFSISPSSEYSGLISLGWTGCISLLSKGLSKEFSPILSEASILQHSAFFIDQLSHPFMTTGKTIDRCLLAK